MTTLQAIEGKTILLANIPDIMLGRAESMPVSVAAGEEDVFNETIYCEPDGYCWLRDILGLLQPHLPVGKTEIEIIAGSTVIYFYAFYCLAYLTDAGNMDQWLQRHFLTTSDTKRTTINSKERLGAYGDDLGQPSYQALYLFPDGKKGRISGRFLEDYREHDEGEITIYDVSPEVIDRETGADGQLLGYFVSVGARTMRFLIDPTVDEQQVARFAYKNSFGITEDLSLVGTLSAPRQIDYTAVYLQAAKRTLSPQLHIPYKMKTGILTSEEVMRLTEMLSSERIWFNSHYDKEETLVVFTGELSFEPSSEPGKGVSAEFSFNYSIRERRFEDYNKPRVRTFDETFDKTFE